MMRGTVRPPDETVPPVSRGQPPILTHTNPATATEAKAGSLAFYVDGRQARSNTHGGV